MQFKKEAVNQQAQAARAHCATTGSAPAGYFVIGDGPVADDEAVSGPGTGASA